MQLGQGAEEGVGARSDHGFKEKEKKKKVVYKLKKEVKPKKTVIGF